MGWLFSRRCNSGWPLAETMKAKRIRSLLANQRSTTAFWRSNGKRSMSLWSSSALFDCGGAGEKFFRGRVLWATLWEGEKATFQKKKRVSSILSESACHPSGGKKAARGRKSGPNCNPTLHRTVIFEWYLTICQSNVLTMSWSVLIVNLQYYILFVLQCMQAHYWLYLAYSVFIYIVV